MVPWCYETKRLNTHTHTVAQDSALEAKWDKKINRLDAECLMLLHHTNTLISHITSFFFFFFRNGDNEQCWLPVRSTLTLSIVLNLTFTELCNNHTWLSWLCVSIFSCHVTHYRIHLFIVQPPLLNSDKWHFCKRWTCNMLAAEKEVCCGEFEGFCLCVGVHVLNLCICGCVCSHVCVYESV